MAGRFGFCNMIALMAIIISACSVSTLKAHSTIPTYTGIKKKTEPTTSAVPTPQGSNPWNKLRLPKTLTPRHYNVELQSFLEKNSEGLYIFKGRSTVYFRCTNSTNLILIHSNKLNYTMQGGFLVSLVVTDGSTAPGIKRTWLEVPTQYLVVQLNIDLEVGKEYALYSEFNGELADDLAGFYRSEYKEGNETRLIATTQMEPTDARKAFPCFDEPAMKATFNLTLIHNPQLVVVSNMPVISTSEKVIEGGTWKATIFETTPKMSTYLLAFVVSDFGKIERTNNRVKTGIWGRMEAIEENQGAYALNVTGRILQFYEQYYKVKYPLPKSDQIGIPDFSAGAMENWGLITYREAALFLHPSESSLKNKERALIAMAHELAHQWFGNLVTMRWWNDIWLNEGFATYMEYQGADHVEPTWNIKDLIVFNEIYPVMDFDALATSHPLSLEEDEVNTPEEITALFNLISYNKGAAVIRMLSTFLTEKLFIKGLTSYLLANQYGNTVYRDLLGHWQKAVDNQTSVQLPKSIAGIMDTWVLQMGYPVVTVNTTTGHVTQEHFLLDPESNVTRQSEFNYTWTIPITSMKNGIKQPDIWLQETSATIEAFKADAGSWILLNVKATGYFRVNYDQENMRKLLKQLETNPSAIPPIDRAQIINDAFNLARAQRRSLTSALDTTKFLSSETEYMPWQAALINLSYFKLMFDRSSVYGSMLKYLKKQVQPLFQHFKRLTNNWTVLPDGPMAQYNEVNAINTACMCGIQECLTLASDLFKKWMDNPAKNPIPPILRITIYCNAIAQGGEAEWDFAWKMFENETVATAAEALRLSMGCSKDPWILNRYLEYSMDPTKIRKQDAISTINAVAANPIGQSIAWDFIFSQWKIIYAKFGGSLFSFSDMITGVTKRFSSEYELKQLEQFKKDNGEAGFGTGARALEQAIEKAKANLKWKLQNKELARQWFEAEAGRSD
ncbi:aminopeptidase N-like [Lissotriton helveticus]